MNCKQLAPDMTVGWIINRLSNSITITLCGCIQVFTNMHIDVCDAIACYHFSSCFTYRTMTTWHLVSVGIPTV